MAVHSSLRKISRFGSLAIPLMRPCYLTDSICSQFLPHLILPPSHIKIYRCLQTLFPPSHSLHLAPSDTLKINLLSNYELCSGAHSGCCMVASAAGGLPLRLQWWIGCMVVVAWMDWCAVECGLRRCTSASHDLMSW